jgi:hypothetical protein
MEANKHHTHGIHGRKKKKIEYYTGVSGLLFPGNNDEANNSACGLRREIYEEKVP